MLPVVKFLDGNEHHILPHTWDRKIDGGRQTLKRTQIPLLQAWALTIHKCQGEPSPTLPPSRLAHCRTAHMILGRPSWQSGTRVASCAWALSSCHGSLTLMVTAAFEGEQPVPIAAPALVHLQLPLAGALAHAHCLASTFSSRPLQHPFSCTSFSLHSLA